MEKLRPGRTMDRSIDTTATQQGRIGGIDDRLDRQFGDVTLKRVKLRSTEGLGHSLRQ